MDRRSFIRKAGATGAGAVAAGALAAPAIAQENPKISWRMTSSFPKSLDTIFGGADDVAKHVAAATDGNFQIQTFAAAEIVPALEAADAVSAGTVEAAHTCSYYFVGKDPTYAIGTAIPFGLNGRLTNAWFYEGNGNALMNEFYATQGIYAMPAGNTGAQMGGWLDENGEKISKSKGNGLTIEEWLRYGSEESLGLYLYREPKSAKSLHAGIVPKTVDEYWQFRGRIPEQPIEQQLGNPVWHLLRANGYNGGDGDTLPVTYGLLLNLASVLGTEATREGLAEYVDNYLPGASGNPDLAKLIDTAIAYNRDFVAPTLHKRRPEENEAAALRALDGFLAEAAEDTSAEDLQTAVYEIGKNEDYGFASLRDWFKALYETLLGNSQGPRMGSFIALYGVANTRRLIAEALARA